MSSTNGNGTSPRIPFDESMCERYLLGELSGRERELFETAFFTDDGFFNRFLSVKDELLDLYHRNELDADKKLRVEAHFRSTPPRRQRLAESSDFIRGVTLVADRAAEIKPKLPTIKSESETIVMLVKRFFTVPAVVTAVVVIVLLATGIWIIRRPASPEVVVEPANGINAEPSSNGVIAGQGSAPDANLDNRVPVVTAPTLAPKRPEETEIAINPRPDVPPVESQTPAPNRSADPVRREPVPKPTPESQVAAVVRPDEPKQEVTGDRIESVTLSSTSRSVSGRNTARIGSATRSVVVTLLFGGDAYASYSVRVSTLGGDTVWRGSNITIGKGDGPKSLAIPVPATSLTRKDYIIILEGRSRDGRSEIIREYYLHVDRQ